MASYENRSPPNALRSLFDGYVPGRGKCNNIAMELFNLDVLKDKLIVQLFDHIRNNVYTKTACAYNINMYHGLNFSGLDNTQKIES
jgi:hypothetical protein